MDTREPSPHERAESLFARFQHARPEREEQAFRDLLDRHPDLARELVEIRRGWRMALDFLGGEGAEADPAPNPASEGSGSATDAAAPRRPALVRICGRRVEAGRYRRIREVARGGMGVIHEAHDSVLDRRVAMKLMLPADKGRRELAPNSRSSSLGRFVDEAQVTARLDHPGVVPVHDAGVLEDGVVFFTMKLVSGVDLREILRRTRAGDPEWRVPRVLDVLRRASEAVAFAHDRGVTHRDLKPANIMAGEYGETYVMDWGLAHAGTGSSASSHEAGGMPDARGARATLEGQVLGTPAYMAPEQARGARDEVSPAADVYAMGAILYELLSGTPPYGDIARDPIKVLRLAESGPPTSIEALAGRQPPELLAICAKAMSRDPADRYANMREFAADLRAFAEQRVVRAYATGPFAELTKWVARNRAVAAVGVAATLAIAGVSAWAYRNVVAERNVAVAEGARADRKADDVLRLSALETIRDLRARADRLWPQRTRLDAEYEEWERDARALVADLPRHRARQVELRSRGTRNADGTWTFASDEDAWWHDQLTQLIALLEELQDPEHGLLGEGTTPPHGLAVPRRRQNAREIEALTVSGAAAQAAWSQAIADLGQDPRFAGTEIQPRIGLAPIGRDHVTGLQEFYLPETGAAPNRDAEGRIRLEQDTGIVMVLVPGGTFRMGAQREDPAEPNFDPNAKPEEIGPGGHPIEVTLDPFFISRFEVTQGQWLRFSGDNPGLWNEEQSPRFDLRQPVENVTWLEASRFVYRLGLQLPTEAQWEYACRAGTSTVYHCGSTPDSLAAYANVADLAYARMFEGAAQYEDFDDGFGPPAPPGSLLANAFGLHDMHGNVWEWCRDVFVGNAYHESPPRRGDGLMGGGSGEVRSLRGGSCFTTAVSARCALRAQGKQDLHSYVGVRPVLPIEVVQ